MQDVLNTVMRYVTELAVMATENGGFEEKWLFRFWKNIGIRMSGMINTASKS